MASPNLLSPELVEGTILDALGRSDQQETAVDSITSIYNVPAKTQKYVNVGRPPKMRPWKGDRMSGDFNVSEFSVTNEPYETSIAIGVDHLHYDSTGLLDQRVSELTETVAMHRLQMISGLIQNGDNADALGYDGKPFFATDHVTPGGKRTKAQSNRLTIPVADLKDVVTGTTKANPTLNQFMQAVERGRNALAGMLNDDGDPINMTASSFLVMTPPQYGHVINAVNRSLVNSDQTTAGMSGSTFQTYVNPLITKADTFWLFLSNSAVRPFGFQIGKDYSLKSQAAGSADEYYRNQHVYGIDYEAAALYLGYQKAVQITLS